MIIGLFTILLIVALLGLLFSFIYDDSVNYLHIIVGLTSSILLLILGYNAFIGIDTDHVVGSQTYLNNNLTVLTSSVETTTYQYEWVAMFLIIIGIIGLIYVIINIFNEAADIIQQAENNNLDQHESTITTRSVFDE